MSPSRGANRRHVVPRAPAFAQPHHHLKIPPVRRVCEHRRVQRTPVRVRPLKNDQMPPPRRRHARLRRPRTPIRVPPLPSLGPAVKSLLAQPLHALQLSARRRRSTQPPIPRHTLFLRPSQHIRRVHEFTHSHRAHRVPSRFDHRVQAPVRHPRQDVTIRVVQVLHDVLLKHIREHPLGHQSFRHLSRANPSLVRASRR